MKSWTSVDTQSDLDYLSYEVCWEDSYTLEYYATPAHEDYFPSDISWSGDRAMNLHLLIDADSPSGSFLELTFIQCDRTDIGFLSNFFIQGQVDTLKRVELTYRNHDLKLRCSRLVYRFLNEAGGVRSGRYFQNRGSST